MKFTISLLWYIPAAISQTIHMRWLSVKRKSLGKRKG